MIRFLSGKLKKHTKLAKTVKISEIFNRLVFPLNFNRFCHPMTIQCLVCQLIHQIFHAAMLYRVRLVFSLLAVCATISGYVHILWWFL